MAFEYATPSLDETSVPARSIRHDVDRSEAAGLIIDSLGDESRGESSLRRRELLAGARRRRGRHDISTVLVDAEEVVSATGRATAELLRAIYLDE